MPLQTSGVLRYPNSTHYSSERQGRAENLLPLVLFQQEDTMKKNLFIITIIHLDGKSEDHLVLCECPIDWVCCNYHHDSFIDFTWSLSVL